MSHGASPLATFHLIGDRADLEGPRTEAGAYRPALFGQYSDLSSLRTDFPVVLVHTLDSGVWLKSLTDIIDESLRTITEPGPENEELRRQVLTQEQTIRQLVAGGQRGPFSKLWDDAARIRSEEHPEIDAALQKAREAIGLDGDVIAFDSQLAGRLVTRAWQESERLKSGRLQSRIDRLAQKLSDILQANYINSADARQADKLESTMGSANQSVFDFQAMARILQTAPAAEALPESRRQRIQSAIEVLESQRFVSTASKRSQNSKPTFGFSFADCATALKAFSERLPAMAELIKAISIAELEIDNHYDESRHDRYFDGFDERRLGPGDLKLFPSYLVCIEEADGAAQDQLLRVIRSGLPFKILAQTSDILGDDSLAGGQLTFGTRGQQLARMALGIDSAFVLQAAATSLYRMQDALFDGVATPGPALFSVYCGADYLESASATESRAFPCFVYNPELGPGQASRYSLAGNPHPEDDWAVHSVHYEDGAHDARSEATAFTLVDFIAQKPQFEQRFASITRPDWSDELVPVVEFLQLSGRAKSDKVPYVLLIDNEDVLYRAVVDEKLLDAARRCLACWHNLQEMGGIKNSHAAAAVTQARATWEQEFVPPVAEPVQAAASSAQAAAVTPDAAEPETAPPAEEVPPVSSDDPWIETIRCTTCNECTQINDRIFAYDDEKRAYIADPDAGTYRELVEAAESCQVAIIHPGKPRNPDEPGLEELLERAAPFM
jgi:ferredoxin